MMEKSEKSLKEPGKLRQTVFATIVNLSTMSYGLMTGWQSPAVPQLQDPLKPAVGGEPMTDGDISWLNAIMCLIGTITTMLLLVIPDRFSRKRFGYAISVPMILAWLLIIVAKEHVYIFISKALSGVTGAGIFFLVPNYVSEISCDRMRGILANFLGNFLNFGILLGYVLGSIMSLRVLAVVGAIWSAIYLIFFAFISESPIYLVRQNRTREAIRSLNWLKAGNTQAIEQTLSHIQIQLKESTSMRSPKLSDLFRDRATTKGVIIVVGLFIGQQFSGIFAVISYTVSIFKMSGSSLSPNASSIIVGSILVLGTALSTILVERAGRRPLLLISSLGMCICHCVIGTFCYLQSLQYDVSLYGWIPVATLSVFMIVYGLGLANGPIIMMSEIFARDVASLGSTVGIVICWAGSFILIKIFADLIALLGMHGCFFFLAICCACTFVFCFVFIPETKGRTREDIVNELNRVVQYEENKNSTHIIESNSVLSVHV